MLGQFAAGCPSVKVIAAGAGRSFASVLLIATWCCAQEAPVVTPNPAANGSATNNSPAANPAAPPSAPSGTPAAQDPAQDMKYGKVLVDGAKLRCWPSAVVSPPVFEDEIAKDQVVGVGRSESGFRCITLPLGPLGYVSKKFAISDDSGRVHTKGAKVAFRYRPKTTEAPVAQLADGTELFVIGEQDDWWRVRAQAIEAWLPEAEVQVVEQPDAAMKSAFGELKVKYDAEIKARLDQIAAAKVQAEKDQADEAAVQIVADAFANELKKPVAEQSFEPVETALAKVEATFAEQSGARRSVAALRQRIQAQKFIVEATALRDSKPVPAAETAPIQPKDQLARFQSIGWLRYESRLGGVGTYYIEKGGVRQHLVSCTSGRYDLTLFLGREIGVNGPRRHPVTESLSVLDIERLEVLGSAKL